MPVFTSCEARSPPAVESPPRKKFKFSLKLKTKKKAKAKNPMDSDSEDESGKENGDSSMNFERKEDLNSSFAKSTNTLTDVNTTFGQQSEIVSLPLPYTGLANLGNTCYLNAVLQVLRYCPRFLKSLVNLDELSAQKYCTMSADLTRESPSEDLSSSARSSIIHSIHKLTSKMENAEENYDKFGLEANEVKNRSGWTTLAVRPQNFVKHFSGLCPLFSGYQQHDAQEFLRSFLSLVEEECVGLVRGEQQENAKGSVSTANNESKVRGGCKYPSTITSSVAMETEGQPTKAMVTDESSRTQPNSEVGLNNTGGSSNLQTATFKSLQKEMATSPDNVNIVKCLFEGTLLLQTCCLNCEGLRQRYENFQDISVPVQNTKSENNEGRGNNLSDSEDESDQGLNLSWAISKFASMERLYGDNKYFCDNCATLTEADISTYFEKLPQVLTIHLKRFQTSYGNQSLYTSSWVTKVTKSLHTPQQLSLKKWCSETCSEKNAVYSLFGVVMHSGMSSCNGHYLSYVNVDVLKRQSDGGMNNNGGCSSAVHCETVGEKAMQDDDSCIKMVDQCYNAQVPRKSSGEHSRDPSVKCGSCQSSATKASSLNSPRKDNGVMCHCKIGVTKNANDSTSNFCKKDIRSMRDGAKCHSQRKVEDSKVEEENENLCCEETMDLDDEDTCDYSERGKGAGQTSTSQDIEDTQNGTNTLRHSKTPSRKSSRNTTKTDDYDSDSSSDEDDSVWSMDITRYFKPIPKSQGSTKKPCRNINISDKQGCTLETRSKKLKSLSGKNENDSCSQTTDTVKNVLKPDGSVQKSQGSAFSAFEKPPATNTSRESLNEESNPNHSCSQTTNTSNNVQESKGALQKSSGQCSAFENYHASRSKVQNGHSFGEDVADQDRFCTQTTEGAEQRNGDGGHSSQSSIMLDMELSDELCTDDEKTDDFMKKNRLNERHSQNQSNTDSGTDNIDSDKGSCSNGSTNHVARQDIHNTNHVEPSTTNTCNSSNNDGSNTSTMSSTWLKFDDAEVQEIRAKDMEEILSPSTSCYSTPYLLFYYRC